MTRTTTAGTAAAGLPVTAPAPRPGPDVTTRLAEALCTVVGVDRSDADESSLQEAAAALLPVVDEIARQRAAGELEAVADDRYYHSVIADTEVVMVRDLRARAAALRGER